VDSDYLSDPRIIDTLWHDSPIPKAIVGRDGIFKAANGAWAKLLGYSRAELVGKHFREITHPSDLFSDESEVSRLIGDPKADGYSMVKRYLAKRGAIVWVELHVVAIRDEKGRLELFSVSVVALPEALQTDIARSSWVGDNISRIVNLICQRPREFLAFAVIGLIALNLLPADLLIDFIKTLFLPK